jgi:hypothetical protein
VIGRDSTIKRAMFGWKFLTALARGIRVIPVLVDGMSMPSDID